MKSLQEKYRAVMLCAAIGDTLGMPVEGWKRSQIRRHLGSITQPINPVLSPDKDEEGNIPHISSHLRRGQWTDDTKLLSTTAKSIVSKGLDLQALASESVSLYESELLEGKENASKNFGRTTIAAFENLQKGVSPDISGVMSKYAGNAPALKMAPVGMFMHAGGKYQEGLAFTQRAGKMTHLDERSIASGIVQAHAIYTLLNGESSPQNFINSVVTVCEQNEKSYEQGKKITLTERLGWVAKNYQTIDDEAAYKELGPGWSVTQNYPFTMYMFVKYWDKPLKGLLQIVNFGGDCDSTAAMYGALAGAKNGIFVPKQWINILERKEELVQLADAISQIK